MAQDWQATTAIRRRHAKPASKLPHNPRRVRSFARTSQPYAPISVYRTAVGTFLAVRPRPLQELALARQVEVQVPWFHSRPRKRAHSSLEPLWLALLVPLSPWPTRIATHSTPPLLLSTPPLVAKRSLMVECRSSHAS